jgi:hypothetical protein
MGASIFPGETFRPPRAWAEAARPNLFYWNEVGKGDTLLPLNSLKFLQRKCIKLFGHSGAKLILSRIFRTKKRFQIQ